MKRFWLMNCQNVSEASKMATELYREAIAVPFMSRFVVYGKRHELSEAKLRVYCITDDKEEKTLELRDNFITIAKSKEVEVLENRTQWLEMGGNIVPVTLKVGSDQSLEQSQLSMNFVAFYENRMAFEVRIKDIEQTPPSGRLVFLRDAKNAAFKSDVRSPPVCTLDIQLPPYNREAIEYDELKKKTTLQRGLQSFAFLNGSGSCLNGGSGSAARSTNNMLAGTAGHCEPPRVEFNIRLLANDLTNSDDEFDWTKLAQRLDLTDAEIEYIRHSSSGSPTLLSASPANQTYDMLHFWTNKLSKDELATSSSILIADSASAAYGDILLKALRDLAVDDKTISKNMFYATSLQAATSGHFDTTLYSLVDKSLANVLNRASDEVDAGQTATAAEAEALTSKSEQQQEQEQEQQAISVGLLDVHEERDMIKDSESADVSENEEAKTAAAAAAAAADAAVEVAAVVVAVRDAVDAVADDDANVVEVEVTATATATEQAEDDEANVAAAVQVEIVAPAAMSSEAQNETPKDVSVHGKY